MAGLATVLSIAGTVVSAVGTIASGQAQRDSAYAQAAQYDAQARDERVAAQQKAFDIRRQTKLALSRNQAVGAASGFAANDPGSLDIAGDIAAYGTWQEQVAMYGGDSRAASLTSAADASRRTGNAAATAGIIGAASTLIGGGVSLFQKYGGGYTAPATSLRYG